MGKTVSRSIACDIGKNIGISLIAALTGMSFCAKASGATITALQSTPYVMSANPGASIPIQYNWNATGGTPISECVFVHILDQSGNMMVQDDHWPSSNTMSWNGNVSYQRTLNIPVSAHPGTYTVYVGMYNPNRLRLVAGPGVVGDAILRYQVATIYVGLGVTAMQAGLTSNVFSAGPGQSFNLQYNWSAAGPTQLSERIFVHIINHQTGVMLFQDDHWPTTNTMNWNGFLSYQHTLNVPANAPTGTYDIFVGMYTGPRLVLNPGPGVTGDTIQRYLVGSLNVGIGVTVLPSQTLNAVVQPGDTLTLQYNWSASAPTSIPLVAYVHFIGSHGIAFQDDHWPAPATNTWAGNVTYSHQIKIPRNLRVGNYQIFVGLYDPATGARIPLNPGPGITGVNTDGGDSYVIGTFTQTKDKAAVPDFDGDGKADLLWYNAASGEVDIWPSANSALSRPECNVGQNSGWKVSGYGDFNGDGLSDVLWYNTNSGQVIIWPSASCAANYSTGSVAPSSGWVIAGVGDFDGDGKADILWYNMQSGQLAIWNSGNPSGNSPGTVAPSSGWKISNVGDFDGDGKSDILWYNTQSGQVVIWYGTAGVNWASSSPGTVAPSSGWVMTQVGDFDGDGRSDILWYNNQNGMTAIWYGGVNGQVLPKLVSATSGWEILNVGDYDGDGQMDILWYNTVTGQTASWPDANVGSLLPGIVPPSSGWTLGGSGSNSTVTPSGVHTTMYGGATAAPPGAPTLSTPTTPVTCNVIGVSNQISSTIPNLRSIAITHNCVGSGLNYNSVHTTYMLNGQITHQAHLVQKTKVGE